MSQSQRGAIPKDPEEWPTAKGEDEWTTFCDPKTIDREINNDWENHPISDLLDEGYSPCSRCFPELNERQTE